MIRVSLGEIGSQFHRWRKPEKYTNFSQVTFWTTHIPISNVAMLSSIPISFLTSLELIFTS